MFVLEAMQRDHPALSTDLDGRKRTRGYLGMDREAQDEYFVAEEAGLMAECQMQ